MKKLLFLSCASALLFTACKKDDKGTGTGAANHLTSGKWFVRSNVDNQTSPTVHTYDNFAEYDECTKDDFMQFNADGTYSSDEGATKCDPLDPQVIETGKWKFIDNNTRLITTSSYNGKEYSDTVKVQTLNASTLTVSSSYDYEEDGERYTGTITATLGH